MRISILASLFFLVPYSSFASNLVACGNLIKCGTFLGTQIQMNPGRTDYPTAFTFTEVFSSNPNEAKVKVGYQGYSGNWHYWYILFDNNSHAWMEDMSGNVWSRGTYSGAPNWRTISLSTAGIADFHQSESWEFAGDAFLRTFTLSDDMACSIFSGLPQIQFLKAVHN